MHTITITITVHRYRSHTREYCGPQRWPSISRHFGISVRRVHKYDRRRARRMRYRSNPRTGHYRLFDMTPTNSKFPMIAPVRCFVGQVRQSEPNENKAIAQQAGGICRWMGTGERCSLSKRGAGAVLVLSYCQRGLTLGGSAILGSSRSRTCRA